MTPGKQELYEHLLDHHRDTRIAQNWTKAYMQRAHEADHRRTAHDHPVHLEHSTVRKARV